MYKLDPVAPFMAADSSLHLVRSIPIVAGEVDDDDDNDYEPRVTAMCISGRFIAAIIDGQLRVFHLLLGTEVAVYGQSAEHICGGPIEETVVATLRGVSVLRQIYLAGCGATFEYRCSIRPVEAAANTTYVIAREQQIVPRFVVELFNANEEAPVKSIELYSDYPLPLSTRLSESNMILIREASRIRSVDLDGREHAALFEPKPGRTDQIVDFDMNQDGLWLLNSRWVSRGKQEAYIKHNDVEHVLEGVAPNNLVAAFGSTGAVVADRGIIRVYQDSWSGMRLQWLDALARAVAGRRRVR